MKKRLIGLLLLVAMLVTMVPAWASAELVPGTDHAAPDHDWEGLLAPTPAVPDLHELYVQEGLTSLFTAFAGEESYIVDDEGITWINHVEGQDNATFKGSIWTLGANGGVGKTYIYGTMTDGVFSTTNANNTPWGKTPLHFGLGLLPDEDFTVEYLAYFPPIYAEDTATGELVAHYTGRYTESYHVVDMYGFLEFDSVWPGGKFDNMNNYIRGRLGDAGLTTWSGPAGGPTYGFGSVNFKIDKRDTLTVDTHGLYRDETVTVDPETGDVTEVKASYGTLYNTTVRHKLTDFSTAYTTNGGSYVSSSEMKNGKYYFGDDTGRDFYLSNTAGATFYTVRIYDRVLTADERAQNRMADVLNYYGIELTAEQKANEEFMTYLKDIAMGISMAQDASAKAAEKAELEAVLAAYDSYDQRVAMVDSLYAQEGLAAHYTTFLPGQYDLIAGTWTDRVEGKTATLMMPDRWFAGEFGGVGFTTFCGAFDAATGEYVKNVGTNNYTANVRLDFGIEQLPVDDFTVEYLAMYKPLYVYGVGEADRIARDAEGNKVEAFACNPDVTGLFVDKGSIDNLGWFQSVTSQLDGQMYSGWRRGASAEQTRGALHWMFGQQNGDAPAWYMGANTHWLGAMASPIGGLSKLGDVYQTNNVIRTYVISVDETTTGEGDAAVTTALFSLYRDGVFYHSNEAVGELNTSAKGYADGGYYVAGTEFDDKCRFWLSNKRPTDFFSVRIYDRALTDAEKIQNRAADILLWYNIVLDAAILADDDMMSAIHGALADMTLETDASAYAAQKAEIAALISDMSNISETPAYTRVDADGNPDAEGEYILFGEYPQSVKADGVTITATTDERGYYLGSDGAYYAKVTATPYGSNYKFSSGASVTSGSVYYFKVEPIRWRILSEEGDNAFLLCESILEKKAFDDYNGGNYSSNYAESTMRAWLNGQFYATAFSALQKELINTVTVDNSASTTGYSPNPYACANTNDKVFLPSNADVMNPAYGFLPHTGYDPAREKQVSDYACAQGAYMNTSGYYGNGDWPLRSPSGERSYDVRALGGGGVLGTNKVYQPYYGAVPALQIRLDSDFTPESYVDIHACDVVYDNGWDEMYYRFVPVADGTYEFYSLQEDGDPYGELLNDKGEILASADDGGYRWNFKITYDCVAGETYYLRTSAPERSGKFLVSIEPISFTPAYAETGAPPAAYLDIDPGASNTFTGRVDSCIGHHYRFAPDVSGEYTFSVPYAAAYYMVLRDETGLALIKQSSPFGGVNELTYSCEAGETYYIQLVGEGYGTYTFSVSSLAHEHTPGEWVTVVAPTLEADGLREQYCGNCGELLASEPIPALGNADIFLHPQGDLLYLTVSVDEYTDIKSGSIEFTYDADIFEVVEGEWTISGAMITDFDGTSRGVFGFASANRVSGDVFCLTLRIKDMSAMSTSPIGVTLQLSSADEMHTLSRMYGVTAEHLYTDDCDATCNVLDCDETRVPPHSYTNEYDPDCNACGYVRYMIGDVNDDGRKDSDDAVYLLYHIHYGAEEYPVNQPLDFNFDGRVDSDDAIHLLYNTFFGDELYPLRGEEPPLPPLPPEPPLPPVIDPIDPIEPVVVCEITLDVQGGFSLGSLFVMKGSIPTVPPVAHREGYTFTGWYLDAACTQPYVPAPIESHMTLYAGWEMHEPEVPALAVGDVFTLGTYEQDNDTSNGKEAIEWQVLAVEDDRALVISKYALDVVPYHATRTSVTWEYSDIRGWLKHEFYEFSFTRAEKMKILTTTLTNHDNLTCGTEGGNDTTDQIFLLSLEEADTYFDSRDAQKCQATAYSDAKNVSTERGHCWWWLRSPGSNSQYADINLDGGDDYMGNPVNDTEIAVRPAFWMSLAS